MKTMLGIIGFVVLCGFTIIWLKHLFKFFDRILSRFEFFKDKE